MGWYLYGVTSTAEPRRPPSGLRGIDDAEVRFHGDRDLVLIVSKVDALETAGTGSDAVEGLPPAHAFFARKRSEAQGPLPPSHDRPGSPPDAPPRQLRSAPGPPRPPTDARPPAPAGAT